MKNNMGFAEESIQGNFMKKNTLRRETGLEAEKGKIQIKKGAERKKKEILE